MSDLGDMRRDFQQAALQRRDLCADPLTQFKRWLDQAIAAQILDPTAMTLATADSQGRPSARIVLLKGIDEQGLCFYTSYTSHKAADLAANPQAELVFYWPQMERQVRFEGTVAKVDRRQSEAYFKSRPLGSQISAAASRQSKPVADRKTLHDMAHAVASQAQQHPLTCPADWGGYRLAPLRAEFWVGQPNRLHDRFGYTRQPDDSWSIQRLCP